MPQIRYNERSWAIDLISEINSLASRLDKPIKRASGESTIIGETENLFPDVLLFGEPEFSNILQGWELKFPDTPITDSELITKAETKAKLLGLDSFFIWNVSMAVLYIKNEDLNFIPRKTWNNCSSITARNQVEDRREQWTELLHVIINDLNEYFESGQIVGKTILETLSDNGIVELILRNTDSVATHLRGFASQNSQFDAEVHQWWITSRSEYPQENNRWNVLARINLISWTDKIIFAHILKPFYSAANQVNAINSNTQIDEAVGIFNTISVQCDFWQVLKSQIGEEHLPRNVWNELIQLNELFKAVRIEKADQLLLQELLNAIVDTGKRKAAGQFVTPPALADILVRLTIDDKRKKVYDPCCGTGTIAKAVFKLKIEYGLSPHDAIRSIWASDKYSFPLQMAVLALADPSNIGQVLNVFKADINELTIGKNITLFEPNTGNPISVGLPQMDFIVSNLPFVQQEDIELANPDIDRIIQRIREETQTNLELSGRSDLYGYLPFYLWPLLADSGKLGIITSNSWLGTEWGQIFKILLRFYYDVLYVIISAKGRWFKSTDVVTIITILQKKPTISPSSSNSTKFIALNKRLNDLQGGIPDLTAAILSGNIGYELANIQEYSSTRISHLENMGFEWSSLFADLNWIFEIEKILVSINQLFVINRGERRGWDPMFYPRGKHKIERQYIKPVLKSSRHISTLIAEPDTEAFCCSKSIEQLDRLGHKGALRWIKIFKNEVNERGRSLPDVLKRAGVHWYEMNDSTLADMVALINYDKRLFIAKLRERAFVNQRLIRFTATSGSVDVDLCHALLNSIIGLFYIEALGFGRGLGALDLNATKLRRNLKILSPGLLNNQQIKEIKSSFSTIKRRSVFPLESELQRKDRIEFDKTVLRAYGILDKKPQIVNALTTLFKIRMTVLEE